MENENEVTTGKYTKLFICENTLVPAGAVKEKGIYKSKTGMICKRIKHIEKVGDDELMQLHSIMYMLNKEDSHGNYVDDPKVLRDACEYFMIKGDKVVRHTHEGNPVDATVQQIYIVPKDHPLWKDEKYVSAIANVIQFKDIETYKYYKENDWETSIAGEAEEEFIPVEKSSLFKKIYDSIINKLKEGNLIMDVVKEDKIIDPAVVTPEVPAVPATEEVKIEEGSKTEEIKKEVDQSIIDYVTTVATEITNTFNGKYDELKSMIEEMTNANTTAVEEVKKSYQKELKEVRKELVLEKANGINVEKTIIKKGLMG